MTIQTIPHVISNEIEHEDALLLIETLFEPANIIEAKALENLVQIVNKYEEKVYPING